MQIMDTRAQHAPMSGARPSSFLSTDLLQSIIASPEFCAVLQWIHDAIYAELKPYIHWIIVVLTLLFTLLLVIVGLQIYLIYKIVGAVARAAKNSLSPSRAVTASFAPAKVPAAT